MIRHLEVRSSELKHQTVFTCNRVWIGRPKAEQFPRTRVSAVHTETWSFLKSTHSPNEGTKDSENTQIPPQPRGNVWQDVSNLL